MPRHTTGRALLACLLAYSAWQNSEAATFTVTSTSSISTSGGCDADCSLHDAIVAANATTAADSIAFNISGTGVKTITLDADGLPTITRPVTLDGYTQTGATANSASNGSNAVLTVALTRSNPDPINDTLVNALTFSSTATGSVVRGIAFVQMGATTVSFISTDADSVIIDGNFFGTNAAGDADGGQAPSAAISINASANNVTVGGNTPAARNLFAGIEQGLALFGTNAVVHNNTFGLEDNGSTALALNDVAILAAGDGHVIGGTGSNEGNVFANIDSHAVLVSAQSQGNRILGNVFRNNNTGLAINLQAAGDPSNGVTANDNHDSDTGANNLQNFPEILSAIRSGSSTNVSLSLNAANSRTYRIELYANDNADPSGFGEGQRFLQAFDLTTNSSGFATSIVAVTGSGLPSGDFVTATATDLTSNETSEFSAAVLVGQTFTVNSVDDTTDGTCNSSHCSLREAIIAANADTALDRIAFGIAGAGPHTITVGVGGLPDVTSAVDMDGGTQAGATANTQTGASNDAVRKIILSAPSVVSLADLLNFSAGSDGSTIREIAFKDLDSDGGSLLAIEANDVRVFGCSFGVDASGNSDGGTSGLSALQVVGDGNRIGGTSPSSRLQFGGVSSAMLIAGDDNIITNFTVGLSAAGNATLPVTGAASILVTGFDNTFSSVASAPNRIAGNAGRGIRIVQNRTGNRIGETLFQSNGGIAIDLEAASDPSSGITANDSGDADTGANGLQNHPLITLAERNPDGTGTIQGTLSTNPVNGAGYVIELFHSPAAHASGNGEATTRLASTNVTVNAAGVATFSVNATALPVGGFISALATRSTTPFDTSEFSPAVALRNAPLVVVNTNQSGTGSLADAIQTANTQLGADRVHFAIPGAGPHRITIAATGLATITDEVDINGYSQAGTSVNSAQTGFNATIRIEVSTDAVGPLERMLRFDSGSSGSRVRGLALFRSAGSALAPGIEIASATGVQIDGNLLGLAADGISGAGFDTAVRILDGADFSMVGGTVLSQRNIFANHHSIAFVLADNVSIFGNQIGRRLDGSLQVRSVFNAITSFGESVVIGGPSIRRNIIEGHMNGVVIFDGNAEVSQNVIPDVGAQAIDVGNIGVNSNDPNDLDVGPNGLQNHPVVTSASNNGTQTVLSAQLNSTPNSTFRIEWFVATETSRSLAMAEAFLGESSISTDANGNANASITLAQALPIGSLVTATATATATVPGRTSELAPPERVTGPDFVVNSSNDGNDGSCNGSHCSLREALLAANANADASRIRFNIPGAGSTFTIIPQSTLPAITTSLVLDGYSQPGAAPNTNSEPPNNAVIKIVLDGSTIAGLPSNPEMLSIQASGVEIRGFSIVGLEDGSIGNEAISSPSNVNLQTSDIRIRGNFIGLLPDGVTVDGNHVGINLGGEAGDTDNEIGGLLPEYQNIIAGNGLHAISGRAPGLLIEKNLLGTARDGVSARANGGNGIQFSGDAGALIVDNVIAHNQAGVVVTSSGRGVELLRNSIHDNQGLGMDLGNDGATANDPLDTDTGANNLTNKPELTVTSSSGQDRTLTVTLPGRVNGRYQIEFFAERDCPVDGLPEGEISLSTRVQQAGADGLISFSRSVLLPADFTQVTAYATDLTTGESSEFSTCVRVVTDAVFANSFE